jgi:hypothetical protein
MILRPISIDRAYSSGKEDSMTRVPLHRTPGLVVGLLILCSGRGSAQTQTPGQITQFDPSLNVVDSVITQDPSGNIGIGTTTPAAALDVSSGDLNLSGNLLKGGTLFLHSGPGNTFLGQNAGNLTMSGVGNVGVGFQALLADTTGDTNVAVGIQALQANTYGNANTAVGQAALFENTGGCCNTAVGAIAMLMMSGTGNTAVGVNTLSGRLSGNDNTVVGEGANVAADDLVNATAIGAFAIASGSNTVRLGNTAVTVIEGQVPYTFTSDKNQKENFESVDGEAVLRKIGGLNLTSWNYIGHDPQQFRHYGPVAQEFFAAFGHDAIGTVGTPTTINSGDIEGILMIAVQALERRTTENAALKARIEALEAVVNTMQTERR